MHNSAACTKTWLKPAAQVSAPLTGAHMFQLHITLVATTSNRGIVRVLRAAQTGSNSLLKRVHRRPHHDRGIFSAIFSGARADPYHVETDAEAV